MKILIKGKVWRYPGAEGWHFVYADKQLSEKIRKYHRKRYKGVRVGFGYVPTVATVGKSSWKTTLFPSKKEGVYLIAVKAPVRKKEEIQEGDDLKIHCDLL